MLGKLAKQTAIYGVSTIVVRFLSYLLTPYYTRIFTDNMGEYGILTHVYALVPLALTLLTMGMESSYFRFSARAEEQGGDVAQSKRQLYATTWGATLLTSLAFFGSVMLFRSSVNEWLGESYVENPLFVVIVGLIILLDVGSAIPFARLREQGRAKQYVVIRIVGVVLNILLAVGFGLAGLFQTEFGVGWVFVANLLTSLLTCALVLGVNEFVLPRIDKRLLFSVLGYSLPLLLGGLAGTASEFIDRQMIVELVPENAMEELGVYGAVAKIGVIMMLFYQMYRLAAEPFFLSNFKKEDFVKTNAEALKYYMLVSMVIFLGIALFRDLFALIVDKNFREGMYILPVILGANVLAGVWLNLSFWYKRAERTSLAIVVTGAGLVAMILLGRWLIPAHSYYGAAWARLGSEMVMVAVSWWLNRRYFPTPYAWGRIWEYVIVALCVFSVSEYLGALVLSAVAGYALSVVLFCAYIYYAIKREKIDVRAMIATALKRK